jgi:hypothetical protein
MPLEHVTARRMALVAMLCCVPVAALAIARPALVLKSVAGLSCLGESVCTDDPSRLGEAAELYEGAAQFLASSVAPLEKRPLTVFCATRSCYQFSGNSGPAARTVGRFIIVIGPRGWKPYYLRHEMIHWLQAERLGVLKVYGEPEWFIEGMAYSLSQDPRPMLEEPFQGYRSRFQAWYAAGGKEHLWASVVNP